MNRISGDFYQVSRTALPGQQARIAKTYVESWIVDRPQIVRSGDRLDIQGNVRFWTGTHAATTLAAQIGLDDSQQNRAATVILTESGGNERRFVCRRVSECFRSLELEVDVCASVNQQPLLPSYDTDWHANHPPGLPQRVLTIETAYRETGVAVTITRSPQVVDDAADPAHGWTPAELHDAMETHYSQLGGTWPRWAMWGLLAGQFEESAVGGIMFDAAAELGTGSKGTERQGFAVFRDHSWFQHLVSGQPQNQDQAQAIRQFLYTWVHESGHAFNFLHSWDKARPDSLSWMNYDWKYDQRNGSGAF
jgi:hypothetical protein